MKNYFWLTAALALTVIGAFFKFALLGYDYIGYSLFFLALVIIANHFLPHNIMRILVILICLGLIYFFVVELPIIHESKGDTECERDYLVVLGAAVHGDVPSKAMANRVKGAAEYLNTYPNARAIVSGGQGEDENVSEAQCMKDMLIRLGIDESRIICEDRSTSTMENLTFSFEIIRSLGDEPDGNVAVLSSPYHLYRAKTMADMLGVKAAGVPGKPDYFLTMINFYIREAFGVTHLWVFGR